MARLGWKAAAATAPAIALAFLSGCFAGMMGGPTQTFTGTLHSVRPIGGGEPTGWVLTMGPEGMGGGGMAVDVSKVRKQAMELDGQQVSAQVQMAGGVWKVQSFGIMSPSKPAGGSGTTTGTPGS